MNYRPKVTIVGAAKSLSRIHCGECNWEQFVAAEIDDAIKCCAWCGWSDLEISKVSKQGSFQRISSEKHGVVTVMIPNERIVPDDFMDELFCPFCE